MKLPDMLQTPDGVFEAKCSFSVLPLWNRGGCPSGSVWNLYDCNGIAVASLMATRMLLDTEALKSEDWHWDVYGFVSEDGNRTFRRYKPHFRIKARRAA